MSLFDSDVVAAKSRVRQVASDRLGEIAIETGVDEVPRSSVARVAKQRPVIA